MGFNWRRLLKRALYAILILLAVFALWQLSRRAPDEGDWQTQMSVESRAEFDGDTVTVRNVRDFRYSPTEADMHPAYYDRIYDLRTLKRVWFISEPFNEMRFAAHTFLSFEFGNGDFLSITIEARKTRDQTYSIWKGMLRTYPITYVAADERDAVLLRANLRQDNVYVYPVRLSKPENARVLLTDMLQRMNKLAESPEWYNVFWRNCTSEIARHVNRISPRRISPFARELLLTSHADELALRSGLLDTDLPIDEARKKYFVTERSLEIGDVPDYSRLIREGF